MELKEYFQSYKNYFWEWTTDEDVPDESGYNENNLISIPNVGVIEYRTYILEILTVLQEKGLPLFSPLLLVLYATNRSYVDLISIEYVLRNHPSSAVKYIKDFIDSSIQFLEKLSHLPPNYKVGSNRVLLIQTLFNDDFNKISSRTSKVIISEYEKNPLVIGICAEKIDVSIAKFSKDLRVLAALNSKFPTTDSLILAMKGIVDIPELEDEVVEEETTVETDKDFIQELIEEPKTFQVGSLFKRIWSGLKIPMRHLSPGEQPIGGISDMTNKGDFSRMLLSEFANEDDIFMNRVANNEALYIQREIPPEENIFERIILIDTSLKNWGTPKVLAFASAIAVIKHPKAHSECKVFGLGNDVFPISLNRVEEVIENQNHVSPVLEVSGALEKFFGEEHTERDLEVFFITHQENLNHQKLQKIIHENRDRLKFLVTTSANGELNFYKHHKGTRKHIQKIMLPLQELWANPPKKTHKNQNLPARSLKATDVPLNYPILFPIPVNKIATFLYEGDFFILSAKKQLLKTYLSDNYYNREYYDQYRIHRGCEVLIENISVKPRGQFALAKNKQQHFILCQYQPDKKLISKLNLNTKEYSELNLSEHKIPLNFELNYFNRKFYLRNDDSPWIFEINIDGQISLESVKNDPEITKSNTKVKTELERLQYGSNKLLSNFNFIGINSAKDLVISKYALEPDYNEALILTKNKSKVEIFATKNKNKFTFSEGSEIITDSRGMMTFNSSNKNISAFYIPTSIQRYLAIGTKTEFSGSEYFLPQENLLKMKTTEQMYEEYLKLFIDQILDYGIDN
ncbi:MULTISPECIES: hypothetical protein [Chryseobacterium]|uniref:Uncharacterized protein n=1 Tax=Chryseobacterium taihuense TaxID=1141221 RepID=A0A4U8WB25_9FLAO|nr:MULTISPECIES: hypothetical protein [Chryseobacterium]QQV03261.1 hypothetical protein I6I61_02545 [Chryseobacterium sp. FDAARGOS 1104]VFB03432.1 Uncharacterised protein [Chryseobacterium taihuense]